MGKWKWPRISEDLPRVEFPVAESNLATVFTGSGRHQAKWNDMRGGGRHVCTCGIKKTQKCLCGIQCV